MLVAAGPTELRRMFVTPTGLADEEGHGHVQRFRRGNSKEWFMVAWVACFSWFRCLDSAFWHGSRKISI